MPLKILFISAEVAPFAKVGGLADVAGSLPKALRALGHDVRVVMPAYPRIEEQGRAGGLHFREGGMIVPIGAGGVPAGIFEGVLPGSDVPIYFVAQNQLINRQNLYGYNDDPYRFAFFSRAAFEVANRLGWQFDVLHAHDWHTAPAVTWLATAGQADGRYRGIPSVFTIHNLAHQGLTSWEVLDYLGIITHSLREEPYGVVNFMARGIYHATIINTVSPTYGREIMTGEGGGGLHDLLRFRDNDVYGILNGMDYDVWNPQKDKNLARHFDAETLDTRIENKRALQKRLGLPQRDDVPLLSMVTRLDAQKGLEIVGHALHQNPADDRIGSYPRSVVLYGLAEHEAAEQEAIESAITDAKESASKMGRILNKKIGSIKQISSVETLRMKMVHDEYIRMNRNIIVFPTSYLSVSPDKVEVSVEVAVTFELVNLQE